MPEAGRNMDVGRAIVDALGRERALELMHLAEGGGGGAFVECAKLAGDEFRDRLGAAMRKILQDEMGMALRGSSLTLRSGFTPRTSSTATSIGSQRS